MPNYCNYNNSDHKYANGGLGVVFLPSLFADEKLSVCGNCSFDLCMCQTTSHFNNTLYENPSRIFNSPYCIAK